MDAVGVIPSQFWKPTKFQGFLPVIWTGGGDTIYDVNRRSRSLAHIVTKDQYVSHLPENGLDADLIAPYVAAIEAIDARQATVKWINNHEAIIQADARPGDLISLQINHDPNWRATIAGKPQPIFADGLGLILIDAHCERRCAVDLKWDDTRDTNRAWAMQSAGIVLLFGCITCSFSVPLSERLRLLSVSRWFQPLVFASILLVALVRTSWISEDAYIAFRVTDNFLHGYGLRWNISERVQVFTDPLFLGITTLSTWLSGDVYFSTIVLSILLTLAAFFVVILKLPTSGILIFSFALLFSKGFIDFSASGFENPATHLAIAGYLYCYWRGQNVLLLSLMAALAATNRMDTAILLIPSLLLVYWRTGWRSWKPALIGWWVETI